MTDQLLLRIDQISFHHDIRMTLFAQHDRRTSHRIVFVQYRLTETAVIGNHDIHRIRKGCNPFLPDKSHIHHKLLALGMSQRSAMITIVVSSFVITATNVALSGLCNITVLLLADVAFVTGMNIWLTGRIREKRRSNV